MTPLPEHSDIHAAILAEKWDEVSAHLSLLHPADVAEIIDNTPSRHHQEVFSLIPDTQKPDVLAELDREDAADEILEQLSPGQLSRIIDQMAPDDAADVIAEMPNQQSEEVLSLMEAGGSAEVRLLLQYDEESAGGIMTTDVVSMRETQTVAEALNAIVHMDEREKFYTANLVDAHGKLIGLIDLWDLLREPDGERRLSELMSDNFVSARVDMDQEEVAYLLAKYDLDVLPVVDDQGMLVGRITADDVIDVFEEEATEDIFRLAGSDDAELESGSIIGSCTARLPWLLITLIGGFLTSLILRKFHERLDDAIVLAAFVPIVLAMGGNTGIQSSTLVVRSIALGHSKIPHLTKWLGREMLAGALMGLICGATIGIWAHLVIGSGDNPTALSPIALAASVGIALFAAMTFAASFGAFVPTVLQKFKIDPAVAAGPFVTITNDIAALLIYYGVTFLLILHGYG